MTDIKISSRFDGGNIETLAIENERIRLAIQPDFSATQPEYLWFYFVATGGRGRECSFLIENAGATRWAPSLKNYRIVASYDRQTWFRIPTQLDGTVLSWSHKIERDRVWYAYHEPYPEVRRMALLDRCAATARTRVEVLGKTIEGRDIELVTVGEPGEGKRACWITARQHPGETPAEFAAEYLLDRLLDRADPVVRELLEKAVFFVVPNVNPDGSARGSHRCNAAGVDLNRAWSNATPEKSPEVWLVRERMRKEGVDFCLDLHADELKPFVWPVRPTGIPSYSNRQASLAAAFDQALVRANPDYRPELPKPSLDMAKGKDPLAMCTSWVTETFGCLGIIMEFPFLDSEFAPDPIEGWSGHRSGLFGAACVDALAAVVQDLR